MRGLALLLTFLLLIPVAAQEQQAPECDGPYKSRQLDGESLEKVLENHAGLVAEFQEMSEQISSFVGPFTSEDIAISSANLCGAFLAGADLSERDLTGANLSEANLTDAKLSRAFLEGANLARAFLQDADLSGANLEGADLSGANLRRADLSGANLRDIDLSRAKLLDAKLSGVDLRDADLTGLQYQPAAGQQPSVDSIATATGLSTLWYDQPRALVNLRKLLRDAGYREQERQITYALRRGETEEDLTSEADLLAKLEGIFNYVLFELTTQWGMAPGRALIVLVMLIPVFMLPYIFALWAPKNDGIWRFWSGDRAREDLGSDKPELLTARGPISAIGYALYFSLLSAFHIGWRDLNVGNWIARLQPREYTLRASGWVRTVSGIQSLISVYLLAIWALTYFGRPFE